jgi:hypothetical protein
VLLLASVAAGVAIVLALDDDSPERAPEAGAGPREDPVASMDPETGRVMGAGSRSARQPTA